SHGFASNTNDTRRYARVFAKAGYAAVYFDFCGSGRSKSDGCSTDMSMLTEKEDLSAVLDAVRSLDFVDASQIILAGCSQGGLVSALLAAEREADVAKLILYFPGFCIPDDARRGKMLNARFDPEHVPETFRTVLFIKLGATYALTAQKLDPYREIQTYQKPVFICHGTADRVVNLSYAQRAQREYPNAKLEIIQGGDHGFIFHGFKAAMRATMEFLAKSAGSSA
ncbi:MAG: alpha/beta fold hydrolase, partial [Bacillota bacterium]